jgi:hypothetical protein
MNARFCSLVVHFAQFSKIVVGQWTREQSAAPSVANLVSDR